METTLRAAREKEGSECGRNQQNGERRENVYERDTGTGKERGREREREL
jgi:hypothetical protein